MNKDFLNRFSLHQPFARETWYSFSTDMWGTKDLSRPFFNTTLVLRSAITKLDASILQVCTQTALAAVASHHHCSRLCFQCMFLDFRCPLRMRHARPCSMISFLIRQHICKPFHSQLENRSAPFHAASSRPLMQRGFRCSLLVARCSIFSSSRHISHEFVLCFDRLSQDTSAPR